MSVFLKKLANAGKCAKNAGNENDFVSLKLV